MWDMYATFEDMISQGSGQRDERARTTLMELSSTSSSSSLNKHLVGGQSVTENTVGTISLSSTCNTVNQEIDSVISTDNSANGSSGSVSDENGINGESMTKVETISSHQQTTDIVCPSENSSSTPTSLILPVEGSIESIDNNNNGTITSNDSPNDRCNHRFRPISLSKGKFLPTRQLAVDKLVEKPIMTTNLGGYQSDSGSNSSLANPLLDTISCLTSSDPYSDSDDYDVTRNKVMHQRARRRCRRMLSDRSIRCSPNHLHSCCSSDADSIGYAGSNSIDSGYKSLCPTPEVPESISNLLPCKITELNSIGDKISPHTAIKIHDSTKLASSNSSSSLSAFQRLSNLNSRNSRTQNYIKM